MSDIKVGDRVRDIHGKEGVVFQTGMTGLFTTASSTRVAGVEYADGTKRDGIYADSLTVVPREPVVHRAEKVVPTSVAQVIQLLDTESAVVSAEIDRLQVRLRALNAAKAALS